MSPEDQTGFVNRIIGEALNGNPPSDREVIGRLFEIPTFSVESMLLQAAARQLSEAACNGKAEVHAQTALNIGPCLRDCAFCAFAKSNGVFTEEKEFPMEYLIDTMQQFEADGANALFLMTTGMYPFEKYLEKAAEIHLHLKPETTFIANIGDFDLPQAKDLKDAGVDGVYHAVRLGEGEVTSIPVERRIKTFKAAQDAELSIGTCLEPVGPEHSTGELVEKLLITRDIEPAYSGSARRIPIPGTELAKPGIVSESRMAHILAVVRIVLPLSIKGNCTHEPNAVGAQAGANLFWAEVGANPRDTEEKTEEGRGMSVPDCRRVFSEAEWDYLEGPSAFYSHAGHLSEVPA